MIRYIGIDPGSKGAIAIIFEDDDVVIDDLSNDYITYERILESYREPLHHTIVGVEDVRGRPGQSCVANTTFMKLAGMAELVGWSISTDAFQKVPPQTWKKYFNLTGSKGETKTEKKHRSIELAKKLFPSVADQLTASKDGRAEALLIAEYVRQHYENEDNTKGTKKK